MAVRLNPCFGCPLRDGCGLRDEMRAKVSGLGLRSVWFVCPRLTEQIHPGRRIVIKQPVGVEGHYDEIDIKYTEVNATVTTVRPNDHRFVCTVDPGEIEEEDPLGDTRRAGVDGVRFRKTQAHRRIVKFVDEPDMPVCSSGNVVRDGRCDMKGDNQVCDHEWIEPPTKTEVPF